MRIAPSSFLVIAALATSPALAGPQYTTNFNQGGQIVQSTPQNRTVTGALPPGYTLNSAAWRIQNNMVGVEDGPRPSALRLQLASANPMSGEARFHLSLPRGSNVSATVYDAMGRVVRSLFEGWRDAGVHDFRWDGRDESGGAVAAGLYFTRVMAMDQTLTIRVVSAR